MSWRKAGGQRAARHPARARRLRDPPGRARLTGGAAPPAATGRAGEPCPAAPAAEAPGPRAAHGRRDPQDTTRTGPRLCSGTRDRRERRDTPPPYLRRAVPLGERGAAAAASDGPAGGSTPAGEWAAPLPAAPAAPAHARARARPGPASHGRRRRRPRGGRAGRGGTRRSPGACAPRNERWAALQPARCGGVCSHGV